MFPGCSLLQSLMNWLLKDVAGEPGNYTFLNDPEACPWAIYHWFKEYAEMDE